MLRNKVTLSLSPLALLTLAACGGGAASGGGSGGGGSSFSQSKVLNFEKGPLNNALAFLDYNNNGTLDAGEPSGRTNAKGGITLTATQADYTVVGIADEQTVDASTGATLSGVTLKAPSNSTMVTPTTTLMEESGLTAAQVGKVLGLPDNVDPLTFSAFATGVDAADALAVEKASQQVMSVVNAFAAAAEGSGAKVEDAFEAALKSVAEVVKTKAANLTDSSANASDKKLDFTNTDDLALIKSKVTDEVAKNSDVNKDAFDRVTDNTLTAVKNVNTKIANVSDLTSDTTKNVFSTKQALAVQVKTASKAEATLKDSGKNTITFTDSEKVNDAAKNAAPTDISLDKTEISEDAASLIVGTLSTTDDQDGGSFTYTIAEIDGTDYASFTINQSNGELSFKNQPDYETKSSYNLTIISTDAGGKSFSKSLEIKITDANDTPTVANPIADQTFAEDTPFVFQFNSNVFADVDATDNLTYTAATDSGSGIIYNSLTFPIFTPSSRALSGTADNSKIGTYDIIITATDTQGASVSDTFKLTFTNTNDAPTVANEISDQKVIIGDSLNFKMDSNTFADVDVNDTLTYTTTTVDNVTVPSWLAFNATTQTFSGTPQDSDVGVVNLKVTATDAAGFEVSDNFKIDVVLPNTPSDIYGTTSYNESDNSLNAGNLGTVDADQESGHTYVLKTGLDSASFTLTSAGALSFVARPDYETKSSYSITVETKDADGKTYEETLKISITDSYEGFVISGSTTDRFGYSNQREGVSNLGDVNGDGFDDIIVIDVDADTSYVIYGSTGSGTDVNISDVIAGTGGFSINGTGRGVGYVNSISNAGDLNGDGYDDIIMGASEAGHTSSTEPSGEV